MMSYSKDFKLRCIRHVKMNISSIPTVAELKNIPPKTLYRWLEDYYKFGESSPAKTGVDKGIESWDEWFKPYFNWIQIHPNIKAFCYINWDWEKDWKHPEWLNGRIEENELVRKKYVGELSKAKYIHNTNK
jgi:hypothetical protein